MPIAFGSVANDVLVVLLLSLVVMTSSWALFAPSRFATYARRSVDGFASDCYSILERRQQVWRYYRVFGALMMLTAAWLGYLYFRVSR